MLVGAGPQQGLLMAHAKALGLGSTVEFTGAMDMEGLAEQYARALCLVLPSTSEPWGLVVNEALHHGCPVLVSESCGCRPELVLDGVTGFAYAAGQSAIFFQPLLSFFVADDQLQRFAHWLSDEDGFDQLIRALEHGAEG